MKIWKPVSLLFAVAVVASGASAAAAAPNAPKKPTSESIAQVVKDTAAENGFAQNLVYWAVQGNSVQVGLSSLRGTEGPALEKSLGLRVRTVQEEPIQSAVKTTRVKGNPPAVKKGATTPRPRPGNAPSPMAAAAVSSPPLIDSPTYYGGDRIYWTEVINGTTYVHECTAGGVYTGPGTVYMSTAGHCGGPGTEWHQGYLDRATGTLYYSGIMGTAAAVRWGGGDIDAEMISGGSYAAALWTSSTSALPQEGQAAVGVGTQICADGRSLASPAAVRSTSWTSA